MNGISKDLVEDNLKKLQTLFPETIIECPLEDGGIAYRADLEKLAILLGEHQIPVNDIEYQFRFVERYLFDWPGKRMAIAEALRRSTATLLPKPKDSVQWDNTQNLYIEGDNLEVLKLLQSGYSNSIKMIYIDPPYNTGKTFVYKDNYKDHISSYLKRTNSIHSTHSQANGRFHANWLNIMYPRLKLAQELLSQDGVIFISIDDNELCNLRRIADDIFGEDNFIALISVENNPKGRKNSRFISISNDYCLIYAKEKEKLSFIENIPKGVDDMKMDDSGKFVHKSGKRVLVGQNDFNKLINDFSSDKHYSVYYNAEQQDLIVKKEEQVKQAKQDLIASGYIRYVSHRDGSFVENTYTANKLIELFDNESLEFKEDKIFEKNFNNRIRMKSMLTNRKYKAIVDNQTVDYKIDVNTTSAGTELKALFDSEKPLFSSPKNTNLIKLFMTLLEDKNYTVLDFFSGSATTAHAVMEQNAEDGGTRQFIMVQIAEPFEKLDDAYKAGYKNICQLGRERIRRAAKSISIKDYRFKDKLDIGFRTYKLDTSNIEEWDTEPEDPQPTKGVASRNKQTPIDYLCASNTLKPKRSEIDLLYELILKSGISLSAQVSKKELESKTIWIVAEGQMIVCFEQTITTKDIKQICDMINAELKLPISKCIFYQHAFADDNTKNVSIQTLKESGISKIEML